jgi:hypothetical protein
LNKPEHSIVETTQKGNTVGGDQAGRDINKTTYHIGGAACTQPMAGTIGKLIDKFRQEQQSNVQFQQTVEKLKHYTTSPPGEGLRTLEEKLKAAKRDNLIGFATTTKELFTKKLAKHQFSESAQEIHALLLAEVYSRYHNHIYEHVVNNEPVAVVNGLIQTQIVDPLLSMLSVNVLDHYADDINGMLYFLTGNCHIKWEK